MKKEKLTLFKFKNKIFCKFPELLSLSSIFFSINPIIETYYKDVEMVTNKAFHS
jgi:hypothetical protein